MLCFRIPLQDSGSLCRSKRSYAFFVRSFGCALFIYRGGCCENWSQNSKPKKIDSCTDNRQNKKKCKESNQSAVREKGHWVYKKSQEIGKKSYLPQNHFQLEQWRSVDPCVTFADDCGNRKYCLFVLQEKIRSTKNENKKDNYVDTHGILCCYSAIIYA